jgi:glyoxylase-like metal-dependent hydrolase (beta-lactamase superfamily II)
VHSYFLRGDDGWTLVDTGLGLVEAPWEDVLAQIDGPVVRIFITHMHPDHVGGVNAASAATGAPVYQGGLDFEQCRRVWGSDGWPERIAAWFLRNGMPEEQAQQILTSGHVFAEFMRIDWEPNIVEAGDEVDGWRVHWVPGHADGHLALEKDGVLIAGDSILDPITPAVGLFPESRPDPLGDYLDSLRRIAELDPRVSYGGHGATVERPAERAAEIVAHHDERLDVTEAALDAQPRAGYEVSHTLFARELSPNQRRMAVAETLSHLERLVVLGRAARGEDDQTLTYTAA